MEKQISECMILGTERAADSLTKTPYTYSTVIQLTMYKP